MRLLILEIVVFFTISACGASNQAARENEIAVIPMGIIEQATPTLIPTATLSRSDFTPPETVTPVTNLSKMLVKISVT